MRSHWHLVALLALIMVGLDVALYQIALRNDGADMLLGPGEPRDSMPIMPGEDDGLYLDLNEMPEEGHEPGRHA